MPTPDEGIKQVAIDQLSLPIAASDGNYYLRYRVVSDDQNLKSAWSKLHSVQPNTLWQILGGGTALTSNPTYRYSSDGRKIGISWTIPQLLVNNSFDIFVKYDSATSWTYLATTTSNNYYWDSGFTTSKTENHTVKIRIQIQTNPPTINDVAKFIDTELDGAKSIRPTSLGGLTPSSTTV